jgi:hypothetical protein
MKMVTLLKTVAFPVDAAYTNTHVEAFLHGPDSLAFFPPPESLYTPIFPQDRNLGAASSSVNPTVLKGLTNLPDLTSLLPPTDMDDDDMADRHKEHMVLVDGWRMLQSLVLSLSECDVIVLQKRWCLLRRA